jgi:hypothetical protein
MENCKNCEHSVFDEQWGEYKCKVRETRIYILLNSSECTEYGKKKEKS